MRRGTYSIVARDPDSGELGVAVQSHWFSVGSVVSWAQPGVGAAATQSIAEPAHGPEHAPRARRGTRRAGRDRAVLAPDELADYRQLGIVDARGPRRCLHRPGLHPVRRRRRRAKLRLPGEHDGPRRRARGDGARLPRSRRRTRRAAAAALEAAEEAGGDVRGRQSAALLVAPAVGEPWRTAIRRSRRGLAAAARRTRASRAARAGLRDRRRGRRAARRRDQGERRARSTCRRPSSLRRSTSSIFWAGRRRRGRGHGRAASSWCAAPLRSRRLARCCSSGCRPSSRRPRGGQAGLERSAVTPPGATQLVAIRSCARARRISPSQTMRLSLYSSSSLGLGCSTRAARVVELGPEVARIVAAPPSSSGTRWSYS